MSATAAPLSLRSALVPALRAALQWRLWLLWVLASLAAALLAALPAWGWLAERFDHSVHAAAIAAGRAPALALDALLAREAPLALLGVNIAAHALLMLLLAPLLAGAVLAAIRARAPLGFGALLRGAIGEYGPLLRMLLWSLLLLALAAAVAAGLLAANMATHAHAVQASELVPGIRLAQGVGVLLVVLALASTDAGRGWLAADGRRRSALAAWWRGLRLLLRRPLAVLGVWLGTWLAGLLPALALLWLRQRLDGGSLAAVLAALLLASLIVAVLAWSRIARLYALAALAADCHARR